MRCRADEAPLEQQEAAMRDELSNFEAERDASLYAGPSPLPPPAPTHSAVHPHKNATDLTSHHRLFPLIVIIMLGNTLT